MKPELNNPGVDRRWVDLGNGVRAFLAVPKAGDGPFGAVILGLGPLELGSQGQTLAMRFASSGYVCITPDLANLGDVEPGDPGRAAAPHEPVEAVITSSLSRCLDYLLGYPNVDSQQIAMLGTGASGGYPLLLNSERAELSASLVISGGTDTPESVVANCTAPFLGIWSEQDPGLSLAQIHEFRKLLERNRKSYELIVYADIAPGWLIDAALGVHDPSEPAWSRILAFLQRVGAGDYPRNRVRQHFESGVTTAHERK
jgi:dienelactone hydrolase